MKLIAVTQRTDYVEERIEYRDALDQRWWDFLKLCNIIPIVMPNDIDLARKIIASMSIQGVLLTGGSATPKREDVETFLIKHAIASELPLFGVCHGMQAIQKYFGITLRKVLNHVSHQQEILINGTPQVVNSYHHYGTDETTHEMAVWARAHDGVVKAIRHISLPVAGVMWHPERISPYLERDMELFQKFYSEQQL